MRLTVANLVLVLGALGAVRLGSQGKSLPEAVAELQQDVAELQSEFSSVGPLGELNSLPVGSIVPFAGTLNEGTKDELAKSGWFVCDGAEYNLRDTLYRVVDGGSLLDTLKVRLESGFPSSREDLVRVPDLQNQFLRGVGPGRAVGAREDWSTGLPRSGFRTGGSKDGEHTHAFTGFGRGTDPGDGGGVAFNGHFLFEGADADSFLGPGGHSHTIRGGDPETRPDNVAVVFLIKAFRAAD